MKDRLYSILIVLCAGVLVFWYGQQPQYNWDMVAYMGTVLEYSEHDINKLHDEVYTTLEKEIPHSVYITLVDHVDDRYECLKDARVFYDELEYFRVKPLYTGIVYLVYHMGIPLVLAAHIPSLIAAFFMLIIIYAFLSLYIKRPLAILITVIFGLYPAFSEITDIASPDAMSNMFLMLTLYLIAAGYKGWWLPVTLLLSVICRVDNFIFAGVVTWFVYMQGRRNVLLLTGIIGALGVAGIILIPVLAGDSPDWFLKFAYTDSVADYIQHWRDVLFLFRHSVYDIASVALAIFLMIKTIGTDRKLTFIVTITVVLHMLLFPSLQERFLVAYEFCLAILLVKYVVSRYAHLQLQRLSLQ